MDTSLLVKPTEEITKTLFEETFEMVNCPLESAEVPLFVPLTVTEAPAIGPSFEVTVPVTVCCAMAEKTENMIKANVKNKFFPFL